MSWYIDGYRIDAVFNAEPELSAEIATDALEDGANYTDHVHVLPETLRIDGAVSDYPDDPLVAQIRELERASAATGGYRPSVFARERLEAIHRAGLPVNVITPRRTYEGYTLQTLSGPEAPNVYRFSATFQLTRVVELLRELVTIPTAAGQKNLGFDPVGYLQSVARGALSSFIEDSAGAPIQILDRDGKRTAWFNTRTGKWIDNQGREVDPYDKEQLDRLKRGDHLWVDERTKEIKTPDGIPIAKTTGGAAATRAQQAQAANKTASGRLTRALNPWWNTPYGTTR